MPQPHFWGVVEALEQKCWFGMDAGAEFMRAVLCCWPVLPRLWLQGDWLGLGIAVAFGGALNLLAVCSFLVTDFLPAEGRVWAWMVLGGVWLFAAIRAYRDFP